MDEGSLTGAEMTHRRLRHASPTSAPAWVTANKTGNPEHTTQPAGSSAGGRVPFLVDSIGLCLF